MSKNIPDSVFEKLRKLLARTTERGCTEAEMQAAMQKASELAAEHNLDLSTVQVDKDNKPKLEGGHKFGDSGCKTHRPHLNPISDVCCKCFQVRAVFSYSGDGCTFVGEKTDVQLAAMTYTWLCDLFPKLFREYRKSRSAFHSTQDRREDRKAYYYGLRSGIIEVNRRVQEAQQAQQAAAGNTSYALVIAGKDELAASLVQQIFPKTKSGAADQVDWGRGGFQAGLEKGRTIKLGHALDVAQHPALK